MVQYYLYFILVECPISSAKVINTGYLASSPHPSLLIVLCESPLYVLGARCKCRELIQESVYFRHAKIKGSKILVETNNQTNETWR